MRKLSRMIATILAFLFLSTTAVSANMAAPMKADLGSSISFEKNDELSVLSEVLDIRVDGPEAEIVATYRMKNTTNVTVSTNSMFLSPNVESTGTRVVVKGIDTEFTVNSYVLGWSTQVKTDDWRFVVLNPQDTVGRREDQTVDAISFVMEFAPNEEFDVTVSYRYRMGGYPAYNTNAKYGEIKYYLAPAAMWKNFANITINLYLDEDMPIITSSNVEFKKIGKRTYQYTSDELTVGTLEIEIDENWWQSIFSTIRNPYFILIIFAFSPVVIVALVVWRLAVWFSRKKKKLSQQQQSE